MSKRFSQQKLIETTLNTQKLYVSLFYYMEFLPSIYIVAYRLNFVNVFELYKFVDLDYIGYYLICLLLKLLQIINYCVIIIIVLIFMEEKVWIY